MMFDLQRPQKQLLIASQRVAQGVHRLCTINYNQNERHINNRMKNQQNCILIMYVTLLD